ncbi:MAG: YajQ family cyclic di-GMP-binding protein [Gammaproteobacteria bacterium]|nr:YajQ family cyclic di-GMP-binding protein [Gammaproteobacteria bacterium]
MPSFDVVSKVDMHEMNNAVDQANRETTTRFDFKGSNAKFELADNKITMTAQSKFQLEQMITILENKLAKRKIDLKCIKTNPVQESLHEAKQILDICQGIDRDSARKITKLIKDTKLKVQASTQGEQIRVAGKSLDVLQKIIAMLREQKLELVLQYENFRD